MENEEKKVEGTETNGEQQNVNNAQQAAPQTVQTPQQTVTDTKEGIGAKLKKHWKGFTAGALALGGIITSAVVAYKKGKAAGINSVPLPVEEPEDYSLNPNE